MSRGDSEPAQSDGAGRLPAGVVSDLLDSERRKHLIAVLAEAEEPLPVADLARRVRARERGADPDTLSEESVRNARQEIYHEHLPKLTAVEVVTYDSLVGTVELSTADRRLLSGSGHSTTGAPDGSEDDGN